eukprot:SAG31_NODE_22_length_33849_cov_13.713096_10_plen_951_part_00
MYLGGHGPDLCTGSSHLEAVKFWCLQSVVEAIDGGLYAQLQEAQRAAVKTALVGWLQDSANVAAQNYVKNKFSVCLVRCFVTGDWPTFFHDVLSFVSTGQHAADIFVRVLRVVDDEVACREAQEDLTMRARNTQIKDMMREQCLPQVIDTCFSIIESAGENPAMLPLATSCLDVIPRYTAWVDLGLIACQRFLTMLAHYLSDAGLREGAATNLLAIVSKQMAADAKLPLLRQLELIPLLQAGAALLEGPAADEHAGFIGRMAALTTAFATECMTCVDRVRSGGAEEADQFLLGCVPLVATYMRAMDTGVESQCCVTFLQLYLNRLRKMKSRNPAAAAPHIERVGLLMTVLQEKIAYPADFDFKDPGDDEAAFIRRRKEICVLFRTAADIDQATALTATLAIVNSLSEAGTTFVTVELSLSLLLQLTEAEKATKGRMALEIEGAKNARDSAVAALLAAGVELCAQFKQQRCVAAAYMRLCRGSAAVLRDQPSLVNPVLNVFFDSLRSVGGDAMLAEEAAKIFVKWLQKEGGAALISEICFDEAFAALLDLLQQRPSIELAESIGLMISVDASHAHHLESVLVPMLTQLEQRISAASVQTTGLPDDVDLYIIVCAYVCKGFCSKKTSSALKSGKGPGWAAVSQLLFGTVETAVKAVDAFPTIAGVRSALVTLIRSCLAVLEFHELLPVLPAALHAIIVSAGAAGEVDAVIEVLDLVSSFATRYKQEIGPIFGIPGLVEAVIDLTLEVTQGGGTSTGDDASEVHELADSARDVQRVRKALTYFVFWVSNCGLTGALATEPMRERLPALLHTLSMAVTNKPVEHPNFKNGIISIARLVQCWIGDNADGGAGAMQAKSFICEQLTRLCIQATLSPAVSLADGNGTEAIRAIASMHILCAACYGGDFSRVLVDLLAALGLPEQSDAAAQCVQLVHGHDEGAYAAFLLQLLQHVRAS